MIQLVLIRHANAAPASPGTRDHDRPLDAKGRRDAPDVARRLTATGVRPALVLASSAVRAHATAEAFATVFGAELRVDDDLYGAGPDELWQAALDSGEREVAIVAHDPGMTELATRLAERELRMATCTAVVFTWNDGNGGDADAAAPDVAATAPR